MTVDQSIAILLVAVPAFITALGAVIVGVLNHQKLQELDIKVDGRLTELLATTAASQHAEGVVAGTLTKDQLEDLIREALSKALLVPPEVPGLAAAIERNRDTNDRLRALEAIPAREAVPSLREIQTTGEDTNQRVHEIQETAAEVAEALIAKELAEGQSHTKE